MVPGGQFVLSPRKKMNKKRKIKINLPADVVVECGSDWDVTYQAFWSISPNYNIPHVPSFTIVFGLHYLIPIVAGRGRVRVGGESRTDEVLGEKRGRWRGGKWCRWRRMGVRGKMRTRKGRRVLGGKGWGEM